MFNCREVSRLVSESMDRELSLPKKLGIRFHCLMCRYCARFALQLTRIRELIQKQKEEKIPSLTMDSKTKEKLKKNLMERHHGKEA